jgi:plasmid replication initiation protein
MKPKFTLLNNKKINSDRMVSMSNALIRAGHGLTLSEKRLVSMAISKLDSRQPADLKQPPVTIIAAYEYAELADVSMNTAYDQLKSAAKLLYERSIFFFVPCYKRNGDPIKPSKIVMRWVGQAVYHDHEGWIELHWWHLLVPHLMGLKEHFTSYKLQQTSALRSIYSWRLLELLMRFESTGWAEYSIEDFATSMDATEKQRQDFAGIRRRMIEPAVKELTQKDGWLIKWKPINKGRRVAAVRFVFSRDPNAETIQIKG